MCRGRAGQTPGSPQEKWPCWNVLNVVAPPGHHRRGFGGFTAGEVVVEQDEQHGRQEPTDEALHQAEDKRPLTDEPEAGQDQFPGFLHHPPAREQRPQQHLRLPPQGLAWLLMAVGIGSLLGPIPFGSVVQDYRYTFKQPGPAESTS